MLRWLALLAALLAPLASATAAEGDWQRAELAPGVEVEMRLITSVDATGDLDQVPAGLHVRLPDGWKTYWRSPGDAGLPPSLDLTQSYNLAETEFLYPAPHRFSLFGLDTFGYETEVIYPLYLRPEYPGEPMQLRGRADLLICSDLCVPASADLALDLPSGAAETDGPVANLISRFQALVPDQDGANGVVIERLAPVADAERPTLRIDATSPLPLSDPDLFIEVADYWSFGAPDVEFSEGGTRIIATVPVLQEPSDAAPLTGQTVMVTLVDGGLAAERALTVDLPIQRDAASDWPVFLSILGLAILGGLLLNLMPCVLPVLSLKLLSVVSHGGETPGRIRRGFLASAAGILFSFLVLAGVLIGIQSAGGAIGWGMQFQHPAFLVFMIVLLTLFAGNMLGFFEIVLPGRVNDAAGKVGGNSLAGHFGTGAFATLLATPCSAPFLGTAVGFAMTRGPVELVAVFIALGIGLALPYLAVAAYPRLAAKLPKPGRWMIVLKRILSLALIATAVWLLTVLSVQTSSLTAIVIAGIMVAIGLALWLRHRRPASLGRASVGTVAVLAVVAMLLPAQLPRAASTTDSSTEWAAFSRSAVAERVGEGQIVFVDVTADWCLTCLTNKLLVIDRGEVAETLAGDDVVAMQADWTLPDDAIADFLASYGRYGIPFNIVYGPEAPGGIPLPELLTEGSVMDALRQAGLES
ncbi:MAG: protein-disulfide reductase DsbD domain-containing protein [Pseudomonadota bacterium]